MIRFLSVVCVAGLLGATPSHSADARTTMQASTQAATTKTKQAKEAHPHIRAAIRELEASKKELQAAAHDFGGHRVDAIAAIDEAVKQLKLALANDKK
jgi:hypothetical protein